MADICARLDGLPLAIELAAARTRIFGLQQLHDRLAQQTFLGMLAEGAQDLADHQRTMRSTIAWSYDLLGDEEKRLFRWLGVFVGGAALDAVEAVVSVADDSLMRQLATLLNASLIQCVDERRNPALYPTGDATRLRSGAVARRGRMGRGEAATCRLFSGAG